MTKLVKELWNYPLFAVRYRKVGGIHFVKVGRFGLNFYVSKDAF
jgi:hypothetical protein